MSTVASAPAPDQWVDATAAAKLLPGVNRQAVARLAAKGLIRVRALPGIRARFCRADVERIARGNFTAPASRESA
jgi:hypothetical protein